VSTEQVAVITAGVVGVAGVLAPTAHRSPLGASECTSRGLHVLLERRRDGKPLAVQAQAERSARRLHGRWHALEARGKPRSIVVVAVARELAGHCWALATME